MERAITALIPAVSYTHLNTPCVIIKLRLKHLLNVGKKLSCDLPENNSVDRFDSRK